MSLEYKLPDKEITSLFESMNELRAHPGSIRYFQDTFSKGLTLAKSKGKGLVLPWSGQKSYHCPLYDNDVLGLDVKYMVDNFSCDKIYISHWFPTNDKRRSEDFTLRRHRGNLHLAKLKHEEESGNYISFYNLDTLDKIGALINTVFCFPDRIIKSFIKEPSALEIGSPWDKHLEEHINKKYGLCKEDLAFFYSYRK